MALWFGGDAALEAATHAALARALAERRAPARLWRRAETPEAWAIRDEPRAGDLLVLAEPGYVITSRPVPPGYRLSPGDHGWDPAVARGLDGILYAAGPGVRAGVELPDVDNVHVHAFLARLLGVRPPAGRDADPRSLAPALR
jgi:hypothetical protein